MPDILELCSANTTLGCFCRYNGQAATFSPLRTMLQLLLQKLVSLVSFLFPNWTLSWGVLARSNMNQALLNELQGGNSPSEAVIVTNQDI